MLFLGLCGRFVLTMTHFHHVWKFGLRELEGYSLKAISVMF